ncbi:MAG: hypothetical protein BMS9Abin05_1562 [Rhodothermia bacterium]|nr:MAG: hypothetical protein BMS9Abin05_1562 [Rhodothermia bacterium]
MVRSRLFVMIFGAFMMSVAACDDTVDPILDSDRQFTLWGTLDMNTDVQHIRLIPIREVLDARLGPEPNVSVRSVDLDTGETVAWSDSTKTFENGTSIFLFSAKLKVQPMHTYRIEIASPDLPLITSAETTIPPIPFAEVFEENVSSRTSPSGAIIVATQQIAWHRVGQNPYQIEQWYRFLEFGSFGFQDLLLSYVPPNQYRAGLNELDLSLDLRRQRDSIDKKLNLNQVRLVGLGQTITVLDDAFVPPGGVFDAELLAQPGTMSNVEFGFGFIGSVGRFSVEWVISDESARILSYTPLSGAEKTGYDVSPPSRRQARISAHPWTNE